MAETTTKTKAQTLTVAEKRARAKARGEECVSVHLIKDNDRYSEPLFVSVNGVNCVIQRGIPVKVKRKFADVIEESHTQDGKVVDMMTKLGNEYKEKFKA